ncbi:MAG: DNA mismatch repair endonuclease MutL [Desulfobacterales bacterium]|jgi:DNA mismatch repair protein MutL
MSKIKILPEILSNKIAAGEVVERPASVVKELVENALDAGSTRIMIDIEKGGRSLIRVSDNGSGMGRDDALLALERYATSKIYKDQDLFRIQTLGFRGEALPSIAAVSRFTLVSRDQSADAGIEISVEGGKIKDVTDIGAPKGTMVTIRQLFFNTPARRKFLKTIGTEMGHIADRVASIALGHPGVQFRLTHNGNIVKDWPSTSTPLDRVVNVLGSDLKNNLHSIEFQNNAVSISGWISSPRMTRRTSRGLFIYVNGRFVRDRSVQHALFEGYSQRLVKGQFPIAALFINVPFEEVDVNVHPTKSEVRFARQRDIHEAVKQAVAKTLFAADKTGWDTRKNSTEEAFRPPGQVSEKAQRDWGFGIGDFELKKSEVKSQFYSDSSNGDKHHGIPDERLPRSARPETRTPQPATRNSQPTPRLTQTTIWQKKRFGDMRIIGQLHNTYIIGEADEGLILIDQHAAHERILFEQFSDRATNSPKAAQRLLVPESVELGYREAKALEKLIPNLAELGLDIEPFGGNTFVIKSVPPLLAQREVKPLLVEIVEKIVEIGSSTGLAELLDECRMVMACHGAIRANQALSDKQISGLMTQLDECHNPSHCPHGRPTWIRWDIRTLEKSFKRVV